MYIYKYIYIYTLYTIYTFIYIYVYYMYVCMFTCMNINKLNMRRDICPNKYKGLLN